MNRFFAMDTSFSTSLGVYDFDARCQITRDVGFDGTYLSLLNDAAWADLPKLGQVHPRHGLEVAGVYLALDLANPQQAQQRLMNLVRDLQGTRHIELSIRVGGRTEPGIDPQVDDAVRALLEAVLPEAQDRGLSVLLYPHLRFYVERLEHAAALCAAIGHESLGICMAAYHWYAADGKELPARLKVAAPFLRSANICGSRRVPMEKGGNRCTIECLDEGELDNFTLLGLLRQAGLTGWIGLQGYSNGGDVYAKLRRSLIAYRDMMQRLQQHPHWAVMRQG
jgi:sugar phosphate isomerase/epimerase